MLYHSGFAVDAHCILIICTAKIGTEQYKSLPIAARSRKRLNHENEWGLYERRTRIFRLARTEQRKAQTVLLSKKAQSHQRKRICDSLTKDEKFLSIKHHQRCL